MSKAAVICGAGLISGKEIMALELISGLRERGEIVDVVTSSWGRAEFRTRAAQLGAHVDVMRLGFISGTLNWPAMRMTAHQAIYWPGLLLSYSRFLKTARPRKVIHTNWHHLLLLAPFLKPDRDIFWLHEVIPDSRRYRKFFGWLAPRLQCFVAVSQAVAASLRANGISEQNIHVIHNGIRDPTGGVLEKIEHDKVGIGIVGQVGTWKGHEDLLDAFAKVAAEFPAAELHVFGKGQAQYERKLRERSEALGISGRIFWRGFVADRAAIYRDMSICVVPSRSDEPLPTVAIEAAFFGVPVVATRRGGAPEIVEDGHTGFLVEPATPAELASRLRTLLADAELRREMGENARGRAVEKFSHKRFVEDFLQLMEEK
jgi:glycosyltransferase involved in cell wall biosynthesis